MTPNYRVIVEDLSQNPSVWFSLENMLLGVACADYYCSAPKNPQK